MVNILSGIAAGLARMHSHGLWHNDLHDDNVLVRLVESDENLTERFEPKLIDFGSTKPLVQGQQEPDERCDYSNLSKHVFNLVQRFEFGNQSGLTPSDRTFSSRLRRLAHRLADKDVSRRSLQPSDVMKDIRLALDECATGHNFPSFAEMKEQSRVSFTEPLENTNALSLAPQDIALLFQDSLNWRQRIERSEPVFVVGPRGCGKTMFLRYLSIASFARPLKTENTEVDVAKRLSESRHIGFLVSVGQLRTPFIRSAFKKLEMTDSPLAEDFCREYLNASFVFEVVRSVIWLSKENLVDLSADDLQMLTAVVEELIGKAFLNQRADLELLAEVIDRRVMALSNLHDPTKYRPTDLCRDNVLHHLAQGLRRTTWAAKKEIWFLLDDYSVTVLPPLAQLAYNPVLFRLSTELRIKASSEGDGPILNDTLGRKYREGRELSKVNLGEVYFQADEDEGRHFFEHILDARFRETGKGSLVELHRLLGEHESDKSFGEYVSSLDRPGVARFYGFGLLCRLCSGDVSFIIELLHSLTQGCWERIRKPLTPTEQDEVIKRFAHRQLADLHATSDHGEKLHGFAIGVGNLIKNYLLRSKGKEADERLRIEVEGEGELSRDAQVMHDALVRHSVLIYGGAGKSRKGLPTRKFYFRRLFAPCFPFSPSRKGCIPLTLQHYESWLLNPQTILDLPEDEPKLL
jgi:ABC-type molybdenum transport system ATPase subunit/photorepair protein PhrA